VANPYTHNVDNERVLALARELATAIEVSDMHRARDLALAEIEKDAGKKALLQEYTRLSRDTQMNRLRGIATSFDDEASLSLLYSKLCVAAECRAYLDAKAKIDKTLADVYDILDSSTQYP